MWGHRSMDSGRWGGGVAPHPHGGLMTRLLVQGSGHLSWSRLHVSGPLSLGADAKEGWWAWPAGFGRTGTFIPQLLLQKSRYAEGPEGGARGQMLCLCFCCCCLCFIKHFNHLIFMQRILRLLKLSYKDCGLPECEADECRERALTPWGK